MKKILLILLFGSFSVVHADPYRHDHYHNYRGSYDWLGPAIIGGIVTYELTRPQQVIVQQPQVIQTLPPAPFGYHYENILDANCKCYRTVLIQN